MEDINKIRAATEVVAYVCPNCLETIRLAPRCPKCGQKIETPERYNMLRRERIALVRAMETVCRCLNDERIIDVWLSEGVADGDIKPDMTDARINDDYCDDETFVDIMDAFLECMNYAYKTGGLFCGGVTSTIGDED